MEAAFPLWLGLPFGLRLHPHVLFDVLAYSGGMAVYAATRRIEARRRGTAGLDDSARLWILIGAILGAVVGTKVLAVLEHPEETWRSWQALRQSEAPQLHAWLGGKTLVGGLLGGWAGVEIAKARLGVRTTTGDAFVPALVWGIAVGRIGCWLSGIDDRTYGLPTTLPWGMDLGDGVRRHPAALYESIFVLVVGAALWVHARFLPGRAPPGLRFRQFFAAYFAWRWFIEGWKPTPKIYATMSAIQWASLLGLGLALFAWARLLHPASPGTPKTS